MASNFLKVAIFVHSSMETREGKMRVFNALQAAKELKEAGDIIDLIFDGAGTRTAVEIADPSHQLYSAFKEVEDVVTGICSFCVGQVGMVKQAKKAGFILLDSYHNHPSFRNFLSSGYQIINF
jgi:hypothetical protein